MATMCPSSSLFQPTLPLRGATSRRCRPSREASCFNPRSPCGERRPPRRRSALGSPVSTHAPLAGSDSCPRSRFSRPLVSTHAPLAGSDEAPRVFRAIAPFQPTLPLRGATVELALLHSGGCVVSTHAPLAGSDTRLDVTRAPSYDGFNPRSPCGERRCPASSFFTR